MRGGDRYFLARPAAFDEGAKLDHLTILGAGPAGLAVAYYANRARVPFSVYERSPVPGGLCRTLSCAGHAYDTGAHRFHDRIPQVTADVRALLGSELVPVTAPSRIFDDGVFVDFPPTPVNLIRSAGVRRLGRIAGELLRARTRRGPVHTFEDFATRSFGETLAGRYLIRYSEKVWGLPADQLSPDVSTRRLSGMTLATLVRELVAPRAKADHIDGTFLYPRGGYGRICDALVESLPDGCVATQAGVTRIVCDGERISELVVGDEVAVKPTGQVVSTLPMTVLVRLLGDALPDAAREAASRLAFRTIRLLFLRLSIPRVSDNATIYLPDSRMCITRVHEPRNRSEAMAPPGETALVAEVPCFAGDALAAESDDAIAARVVGELSGTGLIAGSDVVEWRHHWLHAAYPVYSLGYADAVSTIADSLASIGNLSTVGRGGRFHYSHLHDQLQMARDYVAARAWRSTSG